MKALAERGLGRLEGAAPARPTEPPSNAAPLRAWLTSDCVVVHRLGDPQPCAVSRGVRESGHRYWLPSFSPSPRPLAPFAATTSGGLHGLAGAPVCRPAEPRPPAHRPRLRPAEHAASGQLLDTRARARCSAIHGAVWCCQPARQLACAAAVQQAAAQERNFAGVTEPYGGSSAHCSFQPAARADVDGGDRAPG
jgi:hypothetical protein